MNPPELVLVGGPFHGFHGTSVPGAYFGGPIYTPLTVTTERGPGRRYFVHYTLLGDAEAMRSALLSLPEEDQP